MGGRSGRRSSITYPVFALLRLAGIEVASRWREPSGPLSLAGRRLPTAAGLTRPASFPASAALAVFWSRTASPPFGTCLSHRLPDPPRSDLESGPTQIVVYPDLDRKSVV